jgi:predicted nucleotidyltransferase
MSVNTYLTSLASALVLEDTEKANIDTSISTIRSRITSHFGVSIVEQFKFGSSTRGTILPRKADEHSDIDYMVVFDTHSGTYKPQTYLDQLRKFAERYYSTSEIHQSHPTIVLELNHIRFELVPSIRDMWSHYQIPSPASGWSEWLVTDPNGFNQKLTDVNTRNNYQIKPTVRLVKYWNTLNGHHFSSYDLENFVVGLNFWNCNQLKDYFYIFWDNISCTPDTAQYVKDKVQRAKDRISTIRQYERQGYDSLAESEMAKLLPMI